MRLDGDMNPEEIAEALIERYDREPHDIAEALQWASMVDGLSGSEKRAVVDMLWPTTMTGAERIASSILRKHGRLPGSITVARSWIDQSQLSYNEMDAIVEVMMNAEAPPPLPAPPPKPKPYAGNSQFGLF